MSETRFIVVIDAGEKHEMLAQESFSTLNDACYYVGRYLMGRRPWEIHQIGKSSRLYPAGC